MEDLVHSVYTSIIGQVNSLTEQIHASRENK